MCSIVDNSELSFVCSIVESSPAYCALSSIMQPRPLRDGNSTNDPLCLFSFSVEWPCRSVISAAPRWTEIQRTGSLRGAHAPPVLGIGQHWLHGTGLVRQHLASHQANPGRSSSRGRCQGIDPANPGPCHQSCSDALPPLVQVPLAVHHAQTGHAGPVAHSAARGQRTCREEGR